MAITYTFNQQETEQGMQQYMSDIERKLDRKLNRVQSKNPTLSKQDIVVQLIVRGTARSHRSEIRIDYQVIVDHKDVALVVYCLGRTFHFGILDTVHNICRQLSTNDVVDSFKQGASLKKQYERAAYFDQTLESLVVK